MTARSRFYASMSHELRTPINAILGYSTLLLENIYGPLNEKQAEGIDAHAQGGEAPARAGERRARPVEDRGGQDRPAAAAGDVPGADRGPVRHRAPARRPASARRSTLEHEGEPRDGRSATRAACGRSCSTCSRTRSSSASGKPIHVGTQPRDDGGIVHRGDATRATASPPEDQERIFDEFVQLGKTQLQRGHRASGCRSRAASPSCCSGALEVEVGQSGRGARSGSAFPRRRTDRSRARRSTCEQSDVAHVAG